MFNIKSNLLIRSMLLGVLFYGVVSNAGAGNPKWRDKDVSTLILTDCTEDTTLGGSVKDKWYKVAGQAIEYDASGYNGARNILLTGTGQASTSARINFTAAKNTTGYDLIRLTYKMEDTCRLNASGSGTNDIRVYLMTSPTNYRYYSFSTANRIYTKNKWYTISLRIDQPTNVTGTFDAANINYVQFYTLNAAAKGPVIATIGGIAVTASPIATGYFTISLDASETSFLTLGLPVFNRYNCKPTMYHIPMRIGGSWQPTYMSWAQTDSLYKLGWEIGQMGWSHTDFTTFNSDQIAADIKQGFDTLANHGYRQRRLFAVPNGSKSRMIDTSGTQYTDTRRGVYPGELDVPGIASDGAITPMGTGMYVTSGGIIHTDTTVAGRWSTIKIAIDSAVSRKIVTGVIIHKFRDHSTQSSLNGVDMDTATLDSMLHYCDSLKTAGKLDYGPMGKLFTFAPDSCIVFKSVTSTSHSYTLVDSLSTDVDSMKVFLWDSVSGGSKTLRDSTILLRGDTSFTFTRSGLTSGTTYYYWLYGRSISGTWDSTYTMRSVASGTNIVHVRNVAYESTLDNALLPQYMDICYDSTLTNRPMVVLGHGIGGNLSSISDEWKERLVNTYGVFVVATSMRGRSGSGGSPDLSAREICDIVDAAKNVYALYPARINYTKKMFYGPSAGGGNALALSVKFPDYFNYLVDFFGMSNYTNWYNEEPLFQTTMNSWAGALATYPDRYTSRNQILGFKNSDKTRIWVLHDVDDTLVNVTHSRIWRDSAVANNFAKFTYVETAVDSAYRAIHGYPDTSDSPGIIGLESRFMNIFIDSIANDNSLVNSDTLHISGYLKTNHFDIMMADGKNDVGSVQYNLTNREYKIINGVTANAVACTLTVYNATATYTKCSIVRGGITFIKYLHNTTSNTIIIPFALSVIDSATITLTNTNVPTRYTDSNAVFGLLPACVPVGSPAVVWQGPKHPTTITAAYTSFGTGYGWAPPVIKFESGGADSILTNYAPVVDSNKNIAVSMWIKYTGTNAAIRGLFALNATSTSYMWAYIPSSSTDFVFRSNINNAGQVIFQKAMGISSGFNHFFIAKTGKRITVVVNGVNTIIDSLGTWPITTNLTANMVIGRLSTTTSAFNDTLQSTVVYSDLTYDNAVSQAFIDWSLGPTLKSKLVDGVLVSVGSGGRRANRTIHTGVSVSP